MKSSLKSMKDHFIICGFGRMGQRLCERLVHEGRPIVVIEKDPEAAARARELGWTCLCEDATDDRTLEQAGVLRCRSLAAVLPGDVDNLYVVLSARLLRADLQILARASDAESKRKMERAGANRVVSLFETGANKMAQLLTNPNLEDFIEILGARGDEIDLAQVTVSGEVAWRGKPLEETDFRERGILIVGIRKGDGKLIVPPPRLSVVDTGDTLVALGHPQSITDLIHECSGSEVAGAP